MTRDQLQALEAEFHVIQVELRDLPPNKQEGEKFDLLHQQKRILKELMDDGNGDYLITIDGITRRAGDIDNEIQLNEIVRPSLTV